MQCKFWKEALKAQAVAARTYYYSKRLNPCSEAENGEICDSVHCQVYVPKEERLSTWGEKEREANWNKIEEAVEETEGEVLVFHWRTSEISTIFSTSSGKLKNCVDVFSEDVPYLKSTESPGEEIAPKFKTTISIDKSTFISTIKNNYKDSSLSYKNLKVYKNTFKNRRRCCKRN